MILGEFEFNDLYQESYNEDMLTLVFTMILLIGLIIFGSLIMANLIVAIIVSDVNTLAMAAKEQVLINKVLRLFRKMLQIFTLTGNPRCSSESPHVCDLQSYKSHDSCKIGEEVQYMLGRILLKYFSGRYCQRKGKVTLMLSASIPFVSVKVLKLAAR